MYLTNIVLEQVLEYLNILKMMWNVHSEVYSHALMSLGFM